MIKYSPLEYIMIDIANHKGMDRLSFEARIEWVEMNIDVLESVTDIAKDKYRYTAAVMALREIEAGKPTGHLVGLDACASGPQIMSAFMRCEVGARNTGLIGQVRADIYTKTTQIMNGVLNKVIDYDRKTVKYALMPFYYGSVKRPREAFGEGEELTAFYKAQEQVAPGAAKIMNIMLDCWQPLAEEYTWVMPDGFEVKIKVTQQYENKIEVDELENHPTFVYQYDEIEGKAEGRAVPANVVQATDGMIVREMNRRCNYNKDAFTKVRKLLIKRLGQKHLNGVELDSIQKLWMKHWFLSLVDVEELTWDDVKTFDFTYTDGLIKLIDRSLARPSFPVIMVHDEFKCHPNYMNWIRQTYIEILAEISDSNMIEAILSEITGEDIKVPKLADSISELILESDYALS